MNDQMKLEVFGFDPGSELKAFALTVAEKLQLSSPSDSVLRLALRKGKDAIEASCRVVSQAGTFMAETVSDSPARALQEIERKIAAQLDGWKQRRFTGMAS